MRLVTNVNGDYDIVAQIIHEMMKNEPDIKDIFEKKLGRLASSEITCLIEVDNQYVGFIYLTAENTDEFYFVDSGILEKFRGNGYCEQAIDILLNSQIDEYIIGETKVTNGAVNHFAQKKGELIYQYGDRNFYLLQGYLKEKFIEEGMLEKLKEHCLIDLRKPEAHVKVK